MIKSKRIFNINSRNRLGGTDENFTFKIEVPQNEKYDRVCLLDAGIPKSYYLVQSGRNTFTLTEGAQSATVTITPGNYSRTDFKTALTSKLNTSSPNLWTYAISIPTAPDTGKYTYTVTGNGGVQPSFTFTTYLFEQLGFSQNTVNTFAASTITSANVVKFQLEDSIYIHSDIVSGGGDDVLHHITAGTTPSFGTISYECPDVDANSRGFAVSKSNVFRFALTDEDGQLLALNGLNMNLRVMVYRKDPIFDLIAAVIKLNVVD